MVLAVKNSNLFQQPVNLFPTERNRPIRSKGNILCRVDVIVVIDTPY